MERGLVDEVLRCYPSLQAMAGSELECVLRSEIRLVDAPSGSRLFDAGAPCLGFPLVLAGEVVVGRNSGDGRSIELYRVVPGEVCLVSAAGLLSQRPLLAHGTTTASTRLLLVPPTVFERWTEHAAFRRFIMNVLAERLTDLVAVVDAVAFQRLDRRLADYLLGHGRFVNATHQAIADELGTVREMVTRLLNRFEESGLVRLGRERVEILNAAGLRSLAGSPAR